MQEPDDWELNFDSAPFCNGSLHLGHVRTYALGDVRARWLRAQGMNVFYATTFDAFGIPNEIGAEEAGLPTDVYVTHQIERITAQLSALHLSYDSSPIESYSCPGYYRWTQWLFLRLWDMGLVYDAAQPTPYCASCDAFLAHSQINEGQCWRCESIVVSRQSAQWYIRTTQYNDRLYSGIDGLADWSDRARNLLRSHMGRTHGWCHKLAVTVGDQQFALTVFMTESEIATSAALAVRSDHPLIKRLAADGVTFPDRELIQAAKRRTGESETPRAVCFLRVDGRAIPVTVTPPREVPHGTDAIVTGVQDLDIPSNLADYDTTLLTRSSVTVYRAQDWLVSRNRKWGTPLPLVRCAECGVQPVSGDSLPVLLPVHGGEGHSICSKCSSRQPLVDRVLDCFFDDGWSFYSTAPHRLSGENPFEAWKRRPASKVHFHSGYDTYVYLHVFRFIGYTLFDLGYTDQPEPIQFYQGHDLIIAGDKKMAKSMGNAPDLDDLLERYGSDVIRLSVLANANPAKTVVWSEDRLKQGQRIMRSVQDLMALDLTAVDSPGREGRAGDAPAVDSPGREGRAGPDSGRANGSTLAAAQLQRQIDRITKRLDKVDLFIEEYRIGSAIDTVYTATRDVLRLSASDDRQNLVGLAGLVGLRLKLLSFWALFAPKTTGAK